MELGCSSKETDQCMRVENRVPTHLIIMANGIIGSPLDLMYADKQLDNAYPHDVFVYRSKQNHTFRTFEGVDVTGDRLADEVLKVINKRPNLKKISFIGHSMGGLICRYAIAKLYQPKTAVHGNRIAGLEPMSFITFATPHLGCRGHKQVPVLGGFSLVEKAASTAARFMGRSCKHLFLVDK